MKHIRDGVLIVAFAIRSNFDDLIRWGIVNGHVGRGDDLMGW